jgi:hypothetical protein
MAIETWEASGEWGTLHSPDEQVSDIGASENVVIETDHYEHRLKFTTTLPAFSAEPGIDAEGNPIEVLIIE